MSNSSLAPSFNHTDAGVSDIPDMFHSLDVEGLNDMDTDGSEDEYAEVGESEPSNVDPPLYRLLFLEKKLHQASGFITTTDTKAVAKHKMLLHRIHGVLDVAGEMRWRRTHVNLDDLHLYNEQATQVQQNHLNVVHAKLEEIVSLLTCQYCQETVSEAVLDDQERLICRVHADGKKYGDLQVQPVTTHWVKMYASTLRQFRDSIANFLDIMNQLEETRRGHVMALHNLPRIEKNPVIERLSKPLGDRDCILNLQCLWPTLLEDARRTAALHPVPYARYQIVSATVYESRVRVYREITDTMLEVVRDQERKTAPSDAICQVAEIWKDSKLSQSWFHNVDRPFYTVYALR